VVYNLSTIIVKLGPYELVFGLQKQTSGMGFGCT
jgi:hypothetical protein